MYLYVLMGSHQIATQMLGWFAQTAFSLSGWQNYCILSQKCRRWYLVCLCIVFFYQNSSHREDLSQSHRPLHNQTSGRQNDHGPHACYQGKGPHCRGPLLRRWVYMKLLGLCILHDCYQPSSNKRDAVMRLRPVIGAYFWEFCGGTFPLVRWCKELRWQSLIGRGLRPPVVCVHCRQGIGTVVRVVSARATEAECCQISLTKRAPMGPTVT